MRSKSDITEKWKNETVNQAKMTHSNDTYNKISRFMDKYQQGYSQGDYVKHTEARESMVNLVGNIEKAEYQKGLDRACEVIDEMNLGGQYNGLIDAIRNRG